MESQKRQLTFEEKKILCSYLIEEFSGEILSSLGISQKYNGKVTCPCPVHGGDNLSGFSWSPTKKIWSCWTNKCHEKFGNSLIGLVQGIQQYDKNQAMDYIISLCGNSINDIDFDEVRIKEFIRKNVQIGNTIDFVPNFNFKNLHSQYFLDRGISDATVKKFECFDVDCVPFSLAKRACVPIYSIDNKILGFTGRSMTNYQPKWLNYPPNLQKEKNLFGIHLSKESIKNTKTVILTEGPIDMMKMYDCGYQNTLSLMGTSLSKYQLNIIISLQVASVILLLDSDDAGNKATKKISESLSKYFNIFDLSQKLPRDPGDCTHDEIKSFLSEDIEKIIKNTIIRYGN